MIEMAFAARGGVCALGVGESLVRKQYLCVFAYAVKMGRLGSAIAPAGVGGHPQPTTTSQMELENGISRTSGGGGDLGDGRWPVGGVGVGPSDGDGAGAGVCEGGYPHEGVHVDRGARGVPCDHRDRR